MTKILPVVELVERYEQGENTYELAQAYNVNHLTIAARLLGAGVTMRKGGAPRGNTYGHRPGGPLQADAKGYLVTRDRKGAKHFVHRGCWEAQHGPIPEGWVVHHIDGEPDNNCVENLVSMPRRDHERLHKRSHIL